MMIKQLSKPLGILALPLILSAQIQAATTTNPVGVVKITIAAAPATGQSKLTAISATLRGAIKHQGAAASVGSFSTDSQPLNTGVTTWTAAQWTTEPHLCYIENAAGAEEAYLITAMNESTGVLTLATTFDFTSRYTATPTFRICKAQTLGGVFANIDNAFSTADRIYIWNGNAWDTYRYSGGFWKNTLTPTTNADNTVVFPDEGMFVSRALTTAITVTVNGSVPTSVQVSTLPSVSFISSRYPIETTLGNSGLNDSNWTTSDRVYLWGGGAWLAYRHSGGFWKLTTAPTVNADNTPISSDSAIFVTRVSTINETSSAIEHPIPYTP